MNRILGYIFTPVYYLVFGILLGVFHPVQVIAWNIWGYPAQKRTVDILNGLLLLCLRIMGSRMSFSGFDKLPVKRPLIIVSNHQSMHDIPPIVWGFRKHYPKFISKVELGKGIPSISYNLRHGGSALIDRSNKSQAIKEIVKLGRVIEQHNYSACIFPEGTRARDGKVKKFKSAGIDTLLKTAPSALVVPFVIDGHYRLQKYGAFPLSFGTRIRYQVLEPIEPAGYSLDEIVKKTECAIKTALGQDCQDPDASFNSR
jgi:1-acyl-sn-glycerol-3-phosphate acyltransferase